MISNEKQLAQAIMRGDARIELSSNLSSAVGNVQKITSAENLRSRASDEIVPFREFIIKDDTSALL